MMPALECWKSCPEIHIKPKLNLKIPSSNQYSKKKHTPSHSYFGEKRELFTHGVHKISALLEHSVRGGEGKERARCLGPDAQESFKSQKNPDGPPSGGATLWRAMLSEVPPLLGPRRPGRGGHCHCTRVLPGGRPNLIVSSQP